MASSRTLSDTRRRVETARLLSRARATRGDVRARYEDEVIRLNMSVAGDVARRYHGRGIPADDINQVAFLGLVKAVRGFDPTVGDDFLSYAVPTLRGEIRRYFRDCGWTVRPPRSVQEVQARVTAAEAELTQRLGRAPRPAEIAAHLDVTLPLVLDAMRPPAASRPISLDATAHRRRARRVRRRQAGRPRPGLRQRRGPGRPRARSWRPWRPRPPDPRAALLREPHPGPDRRRGRRHPGAGLPPAQQHPGQAPPPRRWR